MSHGEWELFFNRKIYLDETYFVYFRDRQREMTAKELEPYRRIQGYPDRLRFKALAEMNPADNPNVTPMTGRQLLDEVRSGYIPQFDRFFDEDACAAEAAAGRLKWEAPKPTRRLTLVPVQGLEWLLKNSTLQGR